MITLDGKSTDEAKTEEKKSLEIMQSIAQHDIVQPTELGEVVREFNSDVIEDHTRMSTIDMKTRLHWIEVNSVLAMDTLVAFRVCTSRCLSFTRQKKRLNVSIDGMGRRENVELVVGKRERDVSMTQPNMSFGDKFKSALGIGGQKE